MANEKKAAMKTFKENIEQALKGKNTAQDIQKAVADLLKDLGVKNPVSPQK